MKLDSYLSQLSTQMQRESDRLLTILDDCPTTNCNHNRLKRCHFISGL